MSPSNRWRSRPGDRPPSPGSWHARTAPRAGSLLLLAPLLLTAAGTLRAESHRGVPDHVHRAWTTEQDLPQNSVNAVLQDRRGYLWLATFGGLARFDGVHFRTYGTSEYPGLPSDRLLSLFEDSEGTLWVGSERSGAARFRNGAFTRFEAPDGLPLGTVNAFYEGPAGDFWIGSSYGLLRLQGDQFARYTRRPGDRQLQAQAILEEKDGTVWIGTDRGLCRMRGDRIESAFEDTIGNAKVASLLRDDSGALWIGTSVGLYRLRNDALEKIPVEGVPETATVTALSSDRDGNLWAGFTPGGAHRLLDPRSEEHEQATELASGSIVALLEDREGSMWIGTRGDGLHQVSPGKVVSFGGATGLLGTAAVPIIPDGGSGLWIGLTCGGLAHLDDHQVTILDEAEGLVAKCIWSLVRDSEGTLWIGTFAEGLFRLRYHPGDDPADARIEPFGSPDTPGREMRALYETRKLDLLVGTDSGLFVADRGAGDVRDRSRFELVQGTQGLTVYFITEGPDGSVWLGTQRGAYILTPDRQEIAALADVGETLVRAIYHDAEGIAWIGTYGSGLYRFDGQRVFRFGTHNGLPDNMVSRILEDYHGRLWMTGNRGIYRADRKQLERVAEGLDERVHAALYGRSDGMITAETNGGGQPAGHLTPSGVLWVPTIDGVARLDTEVEVVNPFPPPVHLEEILVDGEAVDPSSLVELPRGARNLEVRYTALSFVAPERVRFRYRLEGFDDDWIEAGDRRTAYYPVIPAGEHRFQVIASNGDEIWNDTGASFTFVARPPLLETPWIYIATAIALVGLVWGAARLRMATLRKRERELERQVADRTAELAKLAELTQKLNSGLVLEEVLEYLYTSMGELIPYDRVGFALLDEKRSVVRAVWARTAAGGESIPPDLEIPLGETSLGLLNDRDEPRIIDDLDQHLSRRPTSETTRLLVGTGMRSNLTCPLRARGHLVGFLFFTSREPGTYTTAHARFFRQVAGELSLIIEKSRLYQELLQTKQELEEANRTLQRLAVEDPLTGVANRRAFEERLDEEWRRAIREKHSLGVLMIDIDSFKAFNDAHGHAAGDECLTAVAEALSGGLRRAGDLLARYGGEEFAAILPKAGTEELGTLAETLRQRVEELQMVHGSSTVGPLVTVSVGGASLVPRQGGDPGELIEAADASLYEAKRAGKNCCRVVDAEQHPSPR